MKLRPLGDRVVIKPVEVEVKTKGGIVLPDTVAKEKPTIGEVVAVGDGELVKKLKTGEKIIYSKYAGTEIKDVDTDEKVVILNYNDVLAVVE